jgi:DNA-binding MarR family transcriptional regulator
LAPPSSARRRTPRPLKVTSARKMPGVGLGVLLRNADMIFNRALREELARHDITFSQFQHLWQLFGSDGLTQVDLSHRIGIEAASSTAVIDQLEKRRLIRRERDTADRRRINVTLTSAGRALEKPLTACAMRVNKLARHGLSNAEIDALFTSVNRVIRNLHTRGTQRSRDE